MNYTLPRFLLPVAAIIIAAFLMTPCVAQTVDASNTYIADWPMFHKDYSHDGLSAAIGPVTSQIQWYSDVSGAGVSSPVAANGTIYTLAGGRLVELDLTGQTSWSYPCGNSSQSSPAIGPDGSVYVAAGGGYLYAFGPDKSLRWTLNLGSPTDASPTIGSDGSIYIGCSTGVFRRIAPDGSLKFAYSAGGNIASTAAIGPDGNIYFGCDDGCLYSLRAEGTLRWKHSTTFMAPIRSSPVVDIYNTVYFGTTAGEFYALFSSGGIWWRTSYAGPIYSSPAIAANGNIYFGSRDNYIYCLSYRGSLRWRFLTGGDVDSSPVLDANNTAYVGSSDGNLYALNSDGTLLWSSNMGAAITASPMLLDSGSLYAAAQGGPLQCFSAIAATPAVPVVIDDGATISQNILHATWTTSDATSSVSFYEYAVGTSAGATDIVPFTNIGTANQVTLSSIPLVNGAQYFFAVRTTNKSGVTGGVGVSDGIVFVANAAPATPVVTDDGAYTSLPSLHATWTCDDPTSDIDYYEYAIGTTSGATDIVPFTKVGSDTSVTGNGLSLVNGGSYYFAVRATSKEGVTGPVGVSDGIVLDMTPPSAPVITTQGPTISHRGFMRFSCSATDAESGIARYDCSIGTAPGLADVAVWRLMANPNNKVISGLNLTVGSTYYINVLATNGAGLQNMASSSGITVVYDNPLITQINASATPGAMLITADAYGAVSPITQLQCAIISSPNDINQASWMDVVPGQQTMIQTPFDGGSVYYAAVKAVNSAGAVVYQVCGVGYNCSY